MGSPFQVVERGSERESGGGNRGGIRGAQPAWSTKSRDGNQVSKAVASGVRREATPAGSGSHWNFWSRGLISEFI